MLHAELSCILHAKEFLLYFRWPLAVTLLRVYIFTILSCASRVPFLLTKIKGLAMIFLTNIKGQFTITDHHQVSI